MNKEILKGIESRSRTLHHWFPHISYEDFYQDGVLFVLELLNKRPDMPFLSIMKAINYKYHDLMKGIVRDKKRRVSYDAISEFLDDDGMWEELENISLDHNLPLESDPDTLLILHAAKEEGLGKEEILNLFGVKISASKLKGVS